MLKLVNRVDYELDCQFAQSGLNYEHSSQVQITSQ